MRDLERAAASYLSVDPGRVVAASSGTAGLDLILRHLRLSRDDEIVLPVFGWVSVAAVIRQGGARPIVAGVHGLTVTLEDLEAVSGPATRVWIVTHMRGQPVQGLTDIVSAAHERGIVVVEDCAQAWGTQPSGQHAGTLGDFAFFSTQWNKVISSGDGGIVVCADPEDGRNLHVLAGYGADLSDPRAANQLNVRISAIAAAALIPQIDLLPPLISQLQHGSDRMAEALRPVIAGTEYTVLSLDSKLGANGVTTALGCPGPQQAAALAARLGDAGVAAYRPGQHGDFHQAGTWGVNFLIPPSPQLEAYVDVPTPRRGSTQRAWVTSVCTAVQEVVA